ncbi:hypothetical protein [Algoriphagus sediminis]|uniref:Uncharacterized protein n=1 Tax=Algoriphagus sediminis TaxID=3057113 RepID=A0ABT7YDI0_9BACT|nr:hypothetical protein [Algoriphagus sediminis]MDN3204579.1 hypothetical protein [Algoriphagus sediminis]
MNIKTKVYALFENRTHKEFEGIRSAVNSSPFLILHGRHLDSVKSHFDNTTFERYEWTLYDHKGDKKWLNKKKWTCLDWGETGGRNQNLSYKISSPEGEVRLFHTLTLNWHQTEEDHISEFFIFHILDKLLEISVYNSWAEFEVHERNKALELENQKLKKQIEFFEKAKKTT